MARLCGWRQTQSQKKDDNAPRSSETPPKAERYGEQVPLTPDTTALYPLPGRGRVLCFPEHLDASHRHIPRDLGEAWVWDLQGLMGTNSLAF